MNDSILPPSHKNLEIKSAWHFRALLFCHLLVAILVSSILLPFTAEIWEKIDIGFFKFLNGTLKGNRFLQIFWALANHKMADWVEDLVILSFFIAYVASSKKERRLRCIAELLFSIIYIALIIYFVNRILFREYLRIPRESPTLIVDSCIKLSQEISWLSVKDDSTKSFPGDHATTALLFGASYTFFAKKRLGFIACCYALFLCLPRLITGAHWLTDVLIGSGSIALVFISIAFCTPLHLFFIDHFENFFRYLLSLKKSLINKFTS